MIVPQFAGIIPKDLRSDHDKRTLTMKRMIKLSHLACAAAFAVGFSLPALAEPRHDERHDFHGRDFAHFSREERSAWIGGAWHRDWHNGRLGWWWTVGGVWYSYPEPVYPYPVEAPLEEVEQPTMPAGLPPAQSWYFCDNPSGYYPYVASCPTPWREVPQAPPAGSAPAPQQYAPPPGYAPAPQQYAPPPGYAPAPQQYAPPPGYAPGPSN
jgi:hypothetical protein